MSLSDDTLQACQQKIGYHFRNPQLLQLALTHASCADDRRMSNERLEFLGDAVLAHVVCHELFERFPDYLEGELTKVKSMIVSRKTCSRVADKMELGRFLKVGKGMSTQRKLPSSCVAGAVEAVIGAIYIDGGEQSAREFILAHVGLWLDQADANQHQENFKSMLQQYAQHTMDTTPVYELLDEKGPDHAKCFEVGVVIGHRRFPTAWGPSKKEAEQFAAYCALQKLDVIPMDMPFPVSSSA